MQSLEADSSDTTGYLNVSVEDLNLYFAQTYLKFPKRENKWFWIQEFCGNSDAGPQVVIKTASNSYITRSLDDEQLEFVFPETGLYNFKAGAVFLYRKTERQNKKGLCPGTIGVFNTLNLFKAYHTFPTSFELSQLWRWTHLNVNTTLSAHKEPDYEKTYQRVRQLRVFSRAIDKSFFLAQGITNSFPSIWFRNTLIGNCPSKNKVVIQNPAFLQEAIDFFIPQGVSVDSVDTI